MGKQACGLAALLYVALPCGVGGVGFSGEDM